MFVRRSHTSTCTHIHLHAHTCTCTHVHTHAHIHLHAHTYTHTYTHTLTYIYMHTYTLTYTTRTHMLICIYMYTHTTHINLNAHHKHRLFGLTAVVCTNCTRPTELMACPTVPNNYIVSPVILCVLFWFVSTDLTLWLSTPVSWNGEEEANRLGWLIVGGEGRG